MRKRKGKSLKKRTATISDVHPIGASLDGILIKTNQIDIIKPIIEKNNPKIDANLKGAIEKPVAICIHKFNNL